MCKDFWKKLFGGGSQPVVPITGNRIAYHFAIDDYPGTGNDLPDCVIDQNNFVNFLKKNYPEFQVRTFKNSQVTRSNVIKYLTDQISVLVPGDKFVIGYSGHGTKGTDPTGREADGYSEAWYVWDGPLWDREVSAIFDKIPAGVEVILFLDCCFAKGSTVVKFNGGKFRKSRYLPIQELKPEIGMKRSDLKNNMNNYVVFAGCAENQTSSSTGNGGVFTLNLIKAWERQYTHKEWSDNTALCTRLSGEAQIPNIDGDPNIINKIIFS